jgi:sec-independent protein translocase protein TatA
MNDLLPAMLTPEPILAFFSGGDMLLVLVIALLVFGSKNLPQLARPVGEGMREFK